jgi:hypothetical protein
MVYTSWKTICGAMMSTDYDAAVTFREAILLWCGCDEVEIITYRTVTTSLLSFGHSTPPALPESHHPLGVLIMLTWTMQL